MSFWPNFAFTCSVGERSVSAADKLSHARIRSLEVKRHVKSSTECQRVSFAAPSLVISFDLCSLFFASCNVPPEHHTLCFLNHIPAAIQSTSLTITTMAQKWNDRNLLKLLLLAVTDFKGDYAELASQWATRYRMVF
jgi:hypothetical protein